MRLALQWLPEDGPPPQLLILLHAAGGRGALMRPLAQALRAQFERAAILLPDAPRPVDGGGPGRQWFATRGLSAEQQIAAADAAVGELQEWVLAQQRRLGVDPQATAVCGFAQGATMALELAQQADGLAGRVLAFCGCWLRMPAAAPQLTTLHLLHGSADALVAVAQARAALQHLAALRADATLDIAQGVGHALHPALIASALHQLTHHIPLRTWRAALGQAPAGPLDAQRPARPKRPAP